jgi:hypothetical protein
VNLGLVARLPEDDGGAGGRGLGGLLPLERNGRVGGRGLGRRGGWAGISGRGLGWGRSFGRPGVRIVQSGDQSGRQPNAVLGTELDGVLWGYLFRQGLGSKFPSESTERSAIDPFLRASDPVPPEVNQAALPPPTVPADPRTRFNFGMRRVSHADIAGEADEDDGVRHAYPLPSSGRAGDSEG